MLFDLSKLFVQLLLTRQRKGARASGRFRWWEVERRACARRDRDSKGRACKPGRGRGAERSEAR